MTDHEPTTAELRDGESRDDLSHAQRNLLFKREIGDDLEEQEGGDDDE